MTDVKSFTTEDDFGMKGKVKLVLASKKNANHIVDLLENLDNEDRNCVRIAIGCCYTVFSSYVKKRKSVRPTVANSEGESEASNVDTAGAAAAAAAAAAIAEDVFQEWMHEKYEYFLDWLLEHVGSMETILAEASVDALMNLMVDEYTSRIVVRRRRRSTAAAMLHFPNKFYIRVIQAIISVNSVDMVHIRLFCTQYFHFEDLKYYCLKNIDSLLRRKDILGKPPLSAISHVVTENVHALLSKITPRDDVQTDDMFLSQADVDKLVLDCSEINSQYRAAFSAAWLALLRAPGVSYSLTKKCLLQMDTKIIPYLVEPKLLIDFLSDSFNAGGAISLLALSGLFVLINRYNLDYPDFYQKLYALYEPNLFAVKHKVRFYHLSDTFLSSSHLPAYLVAAFVKRMARLSLFAPLEDVLIMLTLVKNVLTRHPSCRVLVHRKPTPVDSALSSNGARDPYVHEEVDPAKCNALASSLWELSTLRNHYHPDVIKLVESFRNDFGNVEEDLTKKFGCNYRSSIDALLKTNIDEDNPPAMNFVKPKPMFTAEELGNWFLE